MVIRNREENKLRVRTSSHENFFLRSAKNRLSACDSHTGHSIFGMRLALDQINHTKERGTTQMMWPRTFRRFL